MHPACRRGEEGGDLRTCGGLDRLDQYLDAAAAVRPAAKGSSAE
jgi:hypothetical protein